MKHNQDKPMKIDLSKAQPLNRKQRRALVKMRVGAKVSVTGYRVVRQDTGEIVREIGVVNDN